MKFALSTLKEFLQTSADAFQIANKLTDIGLEVENIENQADSLKYFTVAEIIEATPHPNSNKLKICKVKTFDSTELLQIICAASNARAGIKVAYAPINSIIPSNQMQIKKAKIASVESNGMLCSAKELCLGDEDSGIIEIPNNHQIGEKIADIYGKNDAIIEINVTPNRGDCLGVYGIARDLACAGLGTLKSPEATQIISNFAFAFSVKNIQPDSCPAIFYRQIRNLKNCQSPKWLQEKLESAGINSISAIVDITNYIMHLYNRPLHAYDASKISRDIAIDFAKDNEVFQSLKKSSHQLNSKILTIRNNDNPIAIAGVIGSENSSCDLGTTEILLESAYFSKEVVAFSGRNLNILSDSRHRFERGIDPNSCQQAIEHACKLILEICGGEFSEIFAHKQEFPAKIIDFDFNKFKQIIGYDIDQNIADKILENLGFQKIEPSKIKVPSHRHDIFNSEDLVEEILRIHGYNFIAKENLPSLNLNAKNNFDHLHKIRILLANSQLTETISWSFVDSKIQQHFGELSANLFLKNPISAELNYLRSNLIIGLINSYKKNYLRNFVDLSLFEIGNVFSLNTTQRTMISGLRAGKNKIQDHYQDRRDFDFFDVKNDFINICEQYGLKGE
ncbi:MAG: phenylalanine--tRNA ligase subunit beta, partial [Rickettsiales bacterium]